MAYRCQNCRERNLEFVSDGCRVLLGASPEQLVGNQGGFESFIHPDDRERVWAEVQEAVAAGRAYSLEYRVKHDSGWRWVWEQGAAAAAENGSVAALEGFIADITERKCHEQEIERLNRLYAVLSQVNQTVVHARSQQEIFDRVCRAALTYGGFKLAWIGWVDSESHKVNPVASCGEAGQVLGQLQVFADERPEGLGPTGTAIREARTVICEDLAQDPNASPWRALVEQYGVRSAASLPIRVNGNVRGALVLYAGEPGFFREKERLLLEEAASDVSFALDVLEREKQRRHTEAELCNHASRLSSLFRASPIGIALARERIILEVNDRFCEMCGYARKELEGQSTRMLYLSDHDFQEVRHKLYDRIRGQPMVSMETSWRRKNGARFDVLVHASLLDPNNEAAGITFTAMDVTERKQAENRLREQAAILGHSQDAILVLGLDRRITYCNRHAEQLYGRAAHELLGRVADDLLFPDMPPRCIEVCQTTAEHGVWSGETRVSAAWGKPRFLFSRWTLVNNASGQPESILIANTDITEKKRLEEQFLRSQRMESIGTLASGVAHDLNNILTPILMAVDLLRTTTQKPEDEVMLTMLNDGARRGADIVKQLLAFGRGLEGQRVELQPRSLLKEMAKVIQETFPKSITLEPSIPNELWVINADPTQVHQVLLNLCVNARDAMPGGGRLTLSAENVLLDEDYARMNPEARPGAYLVLQICDTGTGIPAELLDKIFDPFFTTKEFGKGTGLGLSTVMGIVKSHGGFVQVTSRMGTGTQFKVYLPAKQGALPEANAGALPRLRKGNGELVLVVDDEESIRSVARRMLEKNGYQALVAKDGVEALVVYSQRKGEIQAVVTDMVMPVMDGPALIRALRGYAPELRVIAMSGLATQQEEAEKAGLGLGAFLMKPFVPELLLNQLHQTLAR